MHSIPLKKGLAIGLLGFTLAQLSVACFAQKTTKAPTPPTCGKTTERVLNPYFDRLLNAQKALIQYEKNLSLQRASHNDKIMELRDAIHGLAKKQKDEAATFDRKIELANGALRKLGLLGLEQASVEGLKHRFDKPGWQWFIREQQEKKAKRMAEFDQGIVGMHIRKIGYTLNRNGLHAAIAKKQEAIAKCARREPSIHLTPLGRSFDGPGIDQYLLTQRQSLDQVKREIQEGTFSLHVAAYGYTTNRNTVLEHIRKAENELAQVRQSWGKKEYRCHNRMIGYTISNGQIEEFIATEQARKGEQTVVHVRSVGYSISGAGIRKKAANASAAGNAKTAKHWRDKLSDWRKAYAEFVKRIDTKIAGHRKALALHRELYEKDLQNRRDHIDGKLKTALAQTPCGSASILQADPKLEKIAEHRRRLSRLGSDPSKNRERVEQYNDRVYVDSSSQVHGDLGDAWSQATGIARNRGRDRESSLPESDSLQTLAGRYMKLKGHIDYLVASMEGFVEAKELAQFLAAQKKIDDFLKRVSQLGEAGADFNQIRKALKSQLNSEIAGLVSNGILSPKRIDALLNAIETTRAGTSKARLLKSRLEALKKVTETDLISRFRAAMSMNIADAYQPAIAKAASEVAEQAKGMSGFDKALVSLSAMNAVAESIDRINSGVPVSEAISRSAANLAVELAIGEIPILAAADVATKILFISYAHYSGDDVWATATVEDVAKQTMQFALDQVATGARWAGDQSLILERSLFDRPTYEALLANVDTAKLSQSLRQVESLLDTIPPGHPDEPRLLRIRASMRQLLRAKTVNRK